MPGQEARRCQAGIYLLTWLAVLGDVDGDGDGCRRKREWCGWVLGDETTNYYCTRCMGGMNSCCSKPAERPIDDE